MRNRAQSKSPTASKSPTPAPVIQAHYHPRPGEQNTTFPIDVTVAWDSLPPSDAVTNYFVSVDGTVVGTLPPTATSHVVQIAQAGTYTFGVSAANQFGTNTPTSVTARIAPPNVIVNVQVIFQVQV